MNGHFQLSQIDVKPNEDFPETGVFAGLPAEVYHDLDGRASSSLIRKIHNKTPAHAKAYLESEDEPTAAMKFGTMMHEAVLEPSRFASRYAVTTQCQALKGDGDQCGSAGKVPFRTEDGAVIWFCGRSSHQPDLDPMSVDCSYCGAPPEEKCWTKSDQPTSPHAARKEAARTVETPDGDVKIDGQADIGKISESKADQVESMRAKLEGHPAASKLLFEFDGLNELTIVFDYKSGDGLEVPAKARIDRLVRHPHFGLLAVDYKTTRNGEPGPHEFGRSIDRRRYDMQGDVYVNACRSQSIPVDAFVIVAQEKEAPYEVSCHLFPMEGHQYIDDNEVADLQTASADVEAAMRQYLQSAKTGEWPGYSNAVVVAQVPSWGDAGSGRE